MLSTGSALSGHGRTSWAPISASVSSPGMVCGVSQAATRASWVNPRLDSIRRADHYAQPQRMRRGDLLLHLLQTAG
ncbi:hypothetical protein V6S20_13210 [Klebsiella pneumoniae]